MYCPKCDSELEAEVMGGDFARGPSSPFRSGPDRDLLDPRIREIDRCPSCGGVWLDRGEMTQGLKEAAEIDGEYVAKQGNGLSVVVLGLSGVHCLRCRDEMHTVQSATVPKVEYEKCPRCHGIWFDKGELERFARVGMPQRALLIGEFT